MKNCYEIEKQLDKRHDKILSFDKIEIDNMDKYHHKRLNYLDRLNTVISIIQKIFPVASQVKVGDFACAQSNLSLILAELGYKVVAVDISPMFIDYSKMKYEKGEIEWFAGNINNLGFTEDMLDIAVAGELIEHCAYPEEIIEKIFIFIRPGGFLILTTPNGARLKTTLPTFKQVFKKEQRKIFEEKQFLPSGEHHLFLFKLEEIKHILPKGKKVVEKGYLGGTILVNKLLPFLKLLPVQAIAWITSILRKIPLINRKTFNNIYVVLKK